MINVMKRMFTNDRQNFYSPHFFQHAQKNPTNMTNLNGRKHSQTHTYELHNDGDEHILIGTNFTQVLFASTRKLTSGVVRLCEGAFRFTLSVSSPMRTNYTNIPTGESRIQIEHIHVGCSNYKNQEMRTHLKF